jgi:Fe-S-cluster containining protein
MKANSPIDNAIVFNEEIVDIEKYLGVKSEHFMQVGRYPEGNPYQTLKHTGKSGCYFYKDGRCEIYPVRPLDCRFFPFDIIEDDDGNLLWIVYTELCPVNFDYRESFEKLKGLFNLPKELALAYSRGNTPGMEANRYTVLDPVYLVSDGTASVTTL